MADPIYKIYAVILDNIKIVQMTENGTWKEMNDYKRMKTKRSSYLEKSYRFKYIKGQKITS